MAFWLADLKGPENYWIYTASSLFDMWRGMAYVKLNADLGIAERFGRLVDLEKDNTGSSRQVGQACM